MEINFNERYNAMKKEFCSRIDRDVLTGEESALIYIISKNEYLHRRRSSIIDLKDRMIHTQILLDGGLSSSEKAMIKLAFNLWNGFRECDNEEFDVRSIFYNLDSHNIETCINAIAIRFKCR